MTNSKAPPDPSLLQAIDAATYEVVSAIRLRDRQIAYAVAQGHAVAAVARAADLDWKTVTRICARTTTS